MATMFEIMVAGEDPGFAGGAARAAFEEIDRIELELSRYAPNSDISRINNLGPHSAVRVGIDAFQCLALAVACWRETGGAFDASLGALMECWVARDRSLRHPSADELERARERTGMACLSLDESAMAVRVGERVPLLDLGAIGKGYAVDRAVELLKEWGVASALVHGGTSSVFAYGEVGGQAGWPVTITRPGPEGRVIGTFMLSDAGLGGSGIEKGRHIIDPRRGVPVDGHRAAWVISESAGRSDALSTACMVLDPDDIRAMIERDGRLGGVVLPAAALENEQSAGGRGPHGGSPDGAPLRFGTLAGFTLSAA
jgi:thiamine biosynthesis lipoprotein